MTLGYSTATSPPGSYGGTSVCGRFQCSVIKGIDWDQSEDGEQQCLGELSKEPSVRLYFGVIAFVGFSRCVTAAQLVCDMRMNHLLLSFNLS